MVPTLACPNRSFSSSPVLFQKRPCYSVNLISEMPGDIQNAFLHLEDVLAILMSLGNHAKYIQC